MISLKRLELQIHALISQNQQLIEENQTLKEHNSQLTRKNNRLLVKERSEKARIKSIIAQLQVEEEGQS